MAATHCPPLLLLLVLPAWLCAAPLAALAGQGPGSTPCGILSGVSLGVGSIKTLPNITTAGACCDACNSNAGCIAWQWHIPPTSTCYLKDNATPSGRPVDPHNKTMSGRRSEPIPVPPLPLACRPPHDGYPFCNTSLSVRDRVLDLISRIPDEDKPNLMTARGRGGKGDQMQGFPQIGVPAYYWGTNCLHSVNGGGCGFDDQGRMHCPTNFPSGPSFGAMFDRALVRKMANVIGVELRAQLRLGLGYNSLDCWGPVVNLNRDPRWGRNGEGGTEDAYAMSELALAWTQGFQAPRPSKLDPRRTIYQGVLTLKHMAVYSLENTVPFNRHTFDANATYGITNSDLASYYLAPFRRAIRDGGGRGIMCSYNAVLGVPTCLSELMRDARQAWNFSGYVTSDTDSVNDAFHSHNYVATGEEAVALALTKGRCDINSGDTYNTYLLNATKEGTAGLRQADVDAAVFRSLEQRFALGLFDPEAAYDWPTVADLGSNASTALSLEASQKSLVLLRNDAGLLPLAPGKSIAVIGPHAMAEKVLIQPYPYGTVCPDHTYSCLSSPFEAIRDLNAGGKTVTAPGCDLFNTSTAGFAEALAMARAADVVVLGLGIETCGLNPAHNVNPKAPGRCIQGRPTTDYVFPDQYIELEAHDRTTIDLPPIQHELAKQVLALNKPTVLFLMNGGAVAFEPEASFKGPSPLAIIEAYYPGPQGGIALAKGLFGRHNMWGRLSATIYKADFVNRSAMVEHSLSRAPGKTYRYFDDALFEFGYGLSLTTWSVAVSGPSSGPCSLATTDAAAACTFTVHVANTGKLAGDVVLHAYFVPLNQTVAPGHLPIRRQLFDFQRLTVAAGASADAGFRVTRASVPTALPSGDLAAVAGAYTVLFHDGSQAATAPLTLTGPTTVVEPFPSSMPQR